MATFYAEGRENTGELTTFINIYSETVISFKQSDDTYLVLSAGETKSLLDALKKILTEHKALLSSK